MKFAVALSACLALVVAVGAQGQGIGMNGDPSQWDDIAGELGKVSKGTIDFDDDPDYGVVGFGGPLTSAGAGPVSAGVVLDNVSIDSVGNYTYDLAAFGPSFGWGNPSNGIVANYFVDALSIDLTEPNHSMVSINHWSIPNGGSGTVDVSFFDKNGALIDTVNVPSPAGGNPVLYWTEDRSVSIARITINDPAGIDAQGIMETGYYVPEPASLSLLLLGGLAAIRRRR